MKKKNSNNNRKKRGPRREGHRAGREKVESKGLRRSQTYSAFHARSMCLKDLTLKRHNKLLCAPPDPNVPVNPFRQNKNLSSESTLTAHLTFTWSITKVRREAKILISCLVSSLKQCPIGYQGLLLC